VNARRQENLDNKWQFRYTTSITVEFLPMYIPLLLSLEDIPPSPLVINRENIIRARVNADGETVSSSYNVYSLVREHNP
jgi:hypothetical protein